MVATLRSFLGWGMSENEEEQEGISVVCCNNCDNKMDVAVELVSSGSASNNLSFSVFACCVISSSWDLASCVTAIFSCWESALLSSSLLHFKNFSRV